MNDVDYDHCRRCGNSYQEQLSNLRNQVRELEAENERLQEYEWKYEELCK